MPQHERVGSGNTTIAPGGRSPPGLHGLRWALAAPRRRRHDVSMRCHATIHAGLPYLLVSALAAQPSSGPTAGTTLAKLSVYAVAGPRAGQTFDAAAEFGTAPCAVLFVHELSRNTAPLIRGFDRLAREHALLGLRAQVVYLADDRTAAEKQLARSSSALQMNSAMTLSTDGADGPGGYGLNRKCTLTLVLGKDGKVTRSLAFTDTGAQDLPKLEQELRELTGALPQDAAGWRSLLEKRYPNSDAELIALTADLLLRARPTEAAAPRMAAARPERPAAAPAEGEGAAKRPHEGKAPDDPELRTLLRAAIAMSASEQDVAEVFARIDARVGNDANLREQAVAMFKLILSLEYGTNAARERAKQYVTNHGGR